MGAEESKQIDTSGNVNNNVILEGPIDVNHDKITILLSIMLIIQIISFGMKIFSTFRHSVKKRYVNQAPNQQQI